MVATAQQGRPRPITRLDEARTTYRTASGEEKETYLSIPYSLVPWLFEMTLAQVRMVLYVWQRTGGWNDYNANPQPVRITMSEWIEGRSQLHNDTGAHLCKQEIQTTRDTLIAQGKLYEEWETPHLTGPRRYALIAPSNPGVGPSQKEDGSWEVLLLTNWGPRPYPIPEGVLQHRNTGTAFLQHRKDVLLQHRGTIPTTQDDSLLQHRREKSRRTFPGQGQGQPIDTTLEIISRQTHLDREGASAPPTSNADQINAGQIQDQIPSGEPKSNDQSPARDEKNPPPAAELATYQTALIPVAVMPTLATTMERLERPASTRSTRRRAKEVDPELEARKQQLKQIWLDYPDPRVVKPKSPAEWSAFNEGINLLAKMEVRPDDQADLIIAMLSWSKGAYLPTPIKMANRLGEVEATLAVLWAGHALPAQQRTPVSEPIEQEQGLEVAGTCPGNDGAADPDQSCDLSMELVADPTWAARLRRFVPDAEGPSTGCQNRDIHMLWGFVRDVLRPGLNTGRKQHLDALTPAWDPDHPRELLLLAAASYTVNFINMTLLREIDGQIGRLLSRFFDRAIPRVVPQRILDQLSEHQDAEGISDE